MTASGPVDLVRQNVEKVLLFGYLGALIYLAPRVASLIRRGWYTAPPYGVVKQTLQALSMVGLSITIIQASGLGIILGAITLMTVDRKKRIQGLLVWITLGCIGIGFLSQDFIPRVFFGFTDHAWLTLVGFAGTVLVGTPGHVISAWRRLEMPVRMEFRYAPRILYAIVALVVVTMWIEYHITYPSIPVFPVQGVEPNPAITFGIVADHIIIDTGAAILYLVIAGRFIQYDASTDVFVLGPKNAGKSTFFVGLWRSLTSVTDRTSGRVDTSRYVETLIDVLSQNPVDEWVLDQTDTDGTGNASLTVERGTVFPRNLTISSKDYPGERLVSVTEYMRGHDTDANHVDELVANIESSDTLICLIDVERIRGISDEADDGSGVTMYMDLVREYRDAKQIVPVVTKADYYDDEFKRDRGLDAYDSANYDEFQEYVTSRLMDHQSVSNLMSSINTTQMYPVYMLTEEGPDGRRYPVDVGGRREYYGFEEVLEVLE